MKSIKIYRISTTQDCIRGVICLDDTPLGVTLELPWKDNARNISAIPVGEYEAELTPASTRLTGGTGKAIAIKNVPGRSGILIHVGNTTLDTQGCILIGQKYGTLYNKPAVLESREAFSKLIAAVGKEPLKVKVVDLVPTPRKPPIPVEEPKKKAVKKDLDKLAEEVSDVYRRGGKGGKQTKR